MGKLTNLINYYNSITLTSDSEDSIDSCSDKEDENSS